jgi:oligoribonuclease NrnB/cAMP/cGMP phosphodiesterase (DHH superfamily)
MSETTRIDTLIYHDKCPDGKGASWPFWRENQNGGKCTLNLYGLSHGQNPPNVENQIVMIVDFCFSRSVLEEMAKTAKKITILDHHESARKDLEGTLPSNVEAIFDMTRSGAQIAWDYVYPGQPRPWFIEVIADRDLWTWKLPDSKELGKALSSKGYYTWEKMEEMHQMPFDRSFYADRNAQMTVREFTRDMIKFGTIYIEQEEKEISSICSKSILTELTTPNGQKYIVRIVGCPSNYRSEVGNRLCERNPDIDFAVMWQYDFLLDEWWISCRGTKSKGINLVPLTKQFHRGGGHPNAAGFTIFGSDRLLPKGENPAEGASTEGTSAEEKVLVKGERLQTYFRALEVPKNRPQDVDLF